MQKVVLASAMLFAALSCSASAQSGGPAEIKQPGPPRLTTPGTSDSVVVKPGGIDNGGPGSIGTAAHSGLGADSVSNNSGVAGNANKPELALPNTGGGGGR